MIVMTRSVTDGSAKCPKIVLAVWVVCVTEIIDNSDGFYETFDSFKRQGRRRPNSLLCHSRCRRG